MKKLLFIDNDDEQTAKRELFHSTDFLKIGCKLDAEYVDTIEVVGDLWRMSRDEICRLFFEGNHAIVTFSVYTPAPVHNSKQQLKMILTTAGQCRIKERVYIDCSGMLIKGLESLIRLDTLKGSDLFYLLQAINNNYIISYENWEPKRVMVSVTNYESDIFIMTDIDLKEILSIEAPDSSRSRERTKI